MAAWGGRVRNATPPVLSSAAALPAERRVLTRRGWAGEMSGLIEQPAGRQGIVRGAERAGAELPDGPPYSERSPNLLTQAEVEAQVER